MELIPDTTAPAPPAQHFLEQLLETRLGFTSSSRIMFFLVKYSGSMDSTVRANSTYSKQHRCQNTANSNDANIYQGKRSVTS